MFEKIISGVLNSEGSASQDDPGVIKSFTDNPDFPYLVSFPRTGSHWLRMIMELYFGKPSLVRAFYFKYANDFTCYHTHDIDLKLRRDNVIYLYRGPVDTIYSQLNYYQENPDDLERQAHWTDLYAQHLSKWLVHDNFTRKKTVISYEGMKTNIHAEFCKICEHFGQDFEPAKLDSVLTRVSKTELKKKTKHDQQVVNLSDAYQTNREDFQNKYGESILDNLYSIEAALEKYLC